MPPPQHQMTTVVLRRDGRHHATVTGMSTDDARRWADEGFQVFQIAVVRGEWAFHHVNSGRLHTSRDAAPDASAVPLAEFLLTNKGE